MTASQTALADGIFDASSLHGGRLASHQQSALDWAYERPMAFLADPTGAGKTAVACALIAYDFAVEGFARGLW